MTRIMIIPLQYVKRVCCRTQRDSGLYSSGSFNKMMIYGALYGEDVKKEVM